MLEVAATVLGGRLTRTPTSVVGTHGGETIIFSVTSWGFSVAVLLQTKKASFSVGPRGWLRRGLRVEGEPSELVMRILDDEIKGDILLLSPVEVRLTQNGLHLERSGGSLPEITAACSLVAKLTARVRVIEKERPVSAWRLALDRPQ